eukprot:86748-Hanusia_phi.AAC.1
MQQERRGEDGERMGRGWGEDGERMGRRERGGIDERRRGDEERRGGRGGRDTSFAFHEVLLFDL